jgi:alpha 1,2-mannosyltransferase
MLAKNSDFEGALRSVLELENRFNRKFHYPYVFLNEVPFTENFKL